MLIFEKKNTKSYGNKDLSALVCPYSTTLNFRTFGCQSKRSKNDLTLKFIFNVMAGLPMLLIKNLVSFLKKKNRCMII